MRRFEQLEYDQQERDRVSVAEAEAARLEESVTYPRR
jgi:hypothetical protein